MSRAAQAPRRKQAADFRAVGARAASLVIGLLIFPACSTTGFGLVDPGVDQSARTGSIASAPPSAGNADRLSDEATIRNAVSSADVEGLAGREVAWANPATGSRGSIGRLAERQAGGLLCRRFVTTRESFDGISLYSGETCMVAPGDWRMSRFEAT